MNPIVAHLGHATPPTLPVRVAVDALAGLLAAAVTNVPMHRQREGTTPAFVVAGTLTGRALTEVSPGVASAIHYATGGLAGVLFALLVEGFVGVLPIVPVISGTGLSLAPHVAATAVVLAVLFLGFALRRPAGDDRLVGRADGARPPPVGHLRDGVHGRAGRARARGDGGAGLRALLAPWSREAARFLATPADPGAWQNSPTS